MSPVPLRRNRDFVLLQIGQALSTTGSESTQIAFPLLVLALTGSPAKAGIVGFARFLPYVVFAIPSGVLVDRRNRRRLMLAADGGRVLAMASLVVVLALHVATFAQIVVVALVEGSLYALFNIAETGALQAVVPPQQLPRAAAAEQSRLAAVQLASAPLGGALFGLGRLVPFLFDAVSYVFSIGSLLAIRTPFQRVRERGATGAWEEVVEGFEWLRGHRFLWAIQLVSAGSNLVFQGLLLAVIVVGRNEGLTSAQIGLLVAALSVVLLLGSITAPWFQHRLSLRTMLLLSLVATLAIGLFVAWPTVYVLVAASLPSAFLVPPVAATVIGYRIAIAPEPLVGRINSVARTIAISGAPAGSLLAGFLLASLSAKTTVAVLTCCAALLVAWAFASPSLRESPSLAELDDVVRPAASPAATG